MRKKVRAGAASDGPKALETVEEDLVSVTRMFNKQEWTMEERFTIPPPMQLNSMVVKLNGGAILLYAPVRIRDEVSFKKSEEIRKQLLLRLVLEPGWKASVRSPGLLSHPRITPSPFQTSLLASLKLRCRLFSKAPLTHPHGLHQVIGATQAEDKLNHVGALVRGRFDFKSDSSG